LTFEASRHDSVVSRNLTFKTVDDNTWKTIFKIK